MDKKDNQISTCVICKNNYTGFGHNAEPLASGKCCDRCHTNLVKVGWDKHNEIIDKLNEYSIPRKIPKDKQNLIGIGMLLGVILMIVVTVWN